MLVGDLSRSSEKSASCHTHTQGGTTHNHHHHQQKRMQTSTFFCRVDYSCLRENERDSQTDRQRERFNWQNETGQVQAIAAKLIM